MKIVIIGDGKVGRKLAAQLSEEDYDIVLIDQNAGKLKEALNQMDIFCITGNGADAEVQKEADVPHADLVIACASTDELNMMSCLLAKRLGARHTIARVRNPIYYRQMGLLKEDLHLSMAVNPELAVAHEIARVLLFPDTSKVETFVKGRVELVEFAIRSDSKLKDLSLAEIYQRFQVRILVCAVKRGKDVFTPQQVSYAIVETNGDLSVIKNENCETPTEIPYTLICDGKMMKDNIGKSGFPESAVRDLLDENMLKPKQVLLMTSTGGEDYYIQPRKGKFITGTV